MPANSSIPFRLLRLRRDPEALRRARDDLVEELSQLTEAQELHVRRIAEVRADLAHLDRLCPGRSRWDAHRQWRRPRIGGPRPIRPLRPSAAPAAPVSGRDLRYAALGVLIRAGHALDLPEIHRRLHAAGYRIVGPYPVSSSPTRSATSTTAAGPCGCGGGSTGWACSAPTAAGGHLRPPAGNRPSRRAQRLATTRTISSPASVGFIPTLAPASRSASILAAAVPFPPETIAPACPIFLPGGAVTPAT